MRLGAAAVAPIWSLALELPYAVGAALKSKKKKKKKKKLKSQKKVFVLEATIKYISSEVTTII